MANTARMLGAPLTSRHVTEVPVLSEPVAWAVRCLIIDQVTAEVVGALVGAGIDSLLLKGPSLADWLYPEGGRSYVDTDLLVAPASFLPAQEVLVGLGFADTEEGFSRHERAAHAVTYERAGPGGLAYWVDLHQSLSALRAHPQKVWESLATGSEEMVVGGRRLRILGRTALAMHVVLHAAQHGLVDGERPLEDLRRALRVVSLAQWGQSAALAAQLGAEDAFGVGLSLLPEGKELSTALGLAVSARPAVRLAAGSRPRGADALAAVADAPSLRAGLARAGRVLIPSRASVRRSRPVARRGRIGLAVGYVSRLGRMAVALGPALVAWVRARRAP